MSKKFETITAPLLIAGVAIAGCAHGSNVAQSTNSAPAAAPPPPTWAVVAPAPASFGASPLQPQLATADSPNLNNAQNVSFPALSSSLRSSSTGLQTVPTSTSASVLSYSSDGFFRNYQLVVPALNINVAVKREWLDFNGIGQSYVFLDEWEGPIPGTTGENIVYFGYGYETPPAAMPTSGSASFTGAAEGYIFSAGGRAYTLGNASFSVDFSSGSITGAFTNMFAYSAGYTLPGGGGAWNDISVSASIAAGTNKFSGATAVSAVPAGGSWLLGNSATGHIDGGFYGPTAQNLGAVWSLSDGTTSAIGGVAAHR